MKKIAVYGSLRRGMYNHALLNNNEAHYLRTENFKIPFKMIPYSSYPALIPDNKVNEIEMEVYEVSDSTYAKVEMLEGYPHFYDKEHIVDGETGDHIEFYVIRDNDKRLQYEYADDDSITDWVSYFNDNVKRD